MYFHFKLQAITLISLCLISLSNCVRILGIFPVPGTSHMMAGSTLMRILAENGNDVTMVSALSLANLPKNLKNIVLTPQKEQEMKVDFYSFDLHPYLQTIVYNMLGPDLLEMVLSHPKFQDLLNSGEKYDVIILEQFYSEGLRYLGKHLQAPLILYSAMDSCSWTNPAVGNPAPPSFVPELSVSGPREMTFFGRLENSFLFLLNELVRNFMVLPTHNRIIKKYFPQAPDISEYYHNVSLVLLNAVSGVNDPVPKVPSMIDIGGFHIKPPKPLPEDLQAILDGAKHGVVYFSMGSNIKSKDMPKETLAAIMKVFSGLKETVLWKWEDEDLFGKSDNIVIRKWLPQNDLLAHKNIKLFITHGGIFSTMEAVYNGVPCLTLPIFGDQALNAKRATTYGYAKWIKFADITEETLKENVRELLDNPKYSENAKYRSRIMRDKPQSASQLVTFWVEYVARHKGAQHLRVASLNLYWYQYLLLDVIIFIMLCTIVFLVSLKYSTRYILNACTKRSSKLKTH
ncbi:hypothetical protein WA026_022506 [Henosepilachna vigintioctopunctata]|uniref:Glucuronosyltransferase n=1 Tax=Henosepilachna vigintioctopunctata TaxID=420089 RepID=A0AAW1UPF7_9CUCU